MSVADWFGGSDLKQKPGLQPFLDNIRGWIDEINPNLTKVGKGAKKMFGALQSGDYDSNPALSGAFAPIRDMYATSVREGQRDAQMGVGAKYGQDNPIAAQRITQLNEERAREGEGQAMSRMVPSLFQTTADIFHTDRAQADQREAMRGQGFMGMLNGWLNSFYNQQKGGIIPGLSQLAQGAGAIAGGFGGGAGGGGG